jgi:hypothetical protein
MARIAIHRGVRAGQRKAVIVLLNFLDGDCPSAHTVALLAIRAQLAFMNIGMAVLAAGPHIAEYRFHVALRARHILVEAAQWVTSLVVIEFWNSADRTPPIRGVAVLAGNI